MTQTVWFLDVDGVINAIPQEGEEWLYESFVAKGFLITYAPELMTFIKFIHESGIVEVRWLTTWGKDANTELCEKLGLPQFEVAKERDYYGDMWWKWLYLAEWADDNPGTPIIWADDDLRYEMTARDWAARESKYRPILTLSPETTVGLTRDHVAQIARFASAQDIT
jgi:hypothetical protein